MTDEAPRLGEFFTFAEMIRTSTGLPNVPTGEARRNLGLLVQHVLDPLRRHLGRPIKVTSGYRCPAVNRKVGGSPQSRHVQGCAADLKVDGLTCHDLVDALQACGVDFDQAIAYAPERGGHLHVQIRLAAPNRKQLLWAPADTLGYLPYTAGVRP